MGALNGDIVRIIKTYIIKLMHIQVGDEIKEEEGGNNCQIIKKSDTTSHAVVI